MGILSHRPRRYKIPINCTNNPSRRGASALSVFWLPAPQQSRTYPRVYFVEVAQPAGLTLRNICGSPDKRYIVEAKGGSLAAFDYDQDGDLDLYVVNGSTLEGFPPETAPRNALYQNAGDATFRDVAAATGVDDAHWGMGAVAADYDNGR